MKYQVLNIKELYLAIIPLFNKYTLQSSKLLNYNDWCKCCDIINNKEYKTQEGIDKL